MRSAPAMPKEGQAGKAMLEQYKAQFSIDEEHWQRIEKSLELLIFLMGGLVAGWLDRDDALACACIELNAIQRLSADMTPLDRAPYQSLHDLFISVLSSDDPAACLDAMVPPDDTMH